MSSRVWRHRLVVIGLGLVLLLLTACGNRVAASADDEPTPAPTPASASVIAQVNGTLTPVVTSTVTSIATVLTPEPATPTVTPEPATPTVTATPHAGQESPLAGVSEQVGATFPGLASALARTTLRTQMGFLPPVPVLPRLRVPESPLAPPHPRTPVGITDGDTGRYTVPAPGTATVYLPALPHASDTPGDTLGDTITTSPATRDRLATTLAGGVMGALPTPTPTPNPLALTEWLAQPVPEDPDVAVDALSVLVATPTPAPAAAAPLPPLEPTPVWAAHANATTGETRSVRVPIFMYHYLSEPPPGADIYRVDLSVTPGRFAAHLDALQANGYTTISFYQLHAHLTQGAALPEKPVILSFDDGYRDNYVHAFPLLRARGMVATFFVNTDFINENMLAYLTWDMVREMYAGGMSIEAHGRNHTSLKDRDTDYLVWQALGNLEAIEQEVGVRPRFISYPAGQYDQLTIDIFASANYWAGVTTVQGATHSSDRLFEMRRVRVRNTTTVDELLRLAALDW
ncbi:MAG: polysaccharide deacetylase family protein [Litorilinea sp.]